MKKVLVRFRVWLALIVYGALDRHGSRSDETIVDDFDRTSKQIYLIKRNWYISHYILWILPRWTYRVVNSVQLRALFFRGSICFWNYLSAKAVAACSQMSVNVYNSIAGHFFETIERRRKSKVERITEMVSCWYNTKVQPVVKLEEKRAREELLADMRNDGMAVVENVCQAHFSKISQTLQNQIHKELGMELATVSIPPNTIFLVSKGYYSIYVVQQFPSVRTVVFKGHGTFRIQFPFVIFFISFYKDSFRSARVFFRSAMMTSMSDDLYEASLPDIWESGKICGPMPDGTLPAAQAIEQCISLFWSSPFENPISHQLNHNYTRMAHKDTRFKNPSTWERASADPEFLKSVQWCRSAHSPKNICSSMMLEQAKREPATIMAEGISAFLQTEFQSARTDISRELARYILSKYPVWTPSQAGLESIQKSAALMLEEWQKSMRAECALVLSSLADAKEIERALEKNLQDCLNEIWGRGIAESDTREIERIVAENLQNEIE